MSQLQHKIETMSRLAQTREDFVDFIKSCQSLMEKDINMLIEAANKMLLLKAVDRKQTSIKKISKIDLIREEE